MNKIINIIRQINKEKDLKFEPIAHKYTDNKGEYEYSASKLIKHSFPPFRKEFYSTKRGLELGISKEEVQAMWAKKGLMSANLGTACHEYITEVLFRGKEEIDYNLFNDFPSGCMDKFMELRPQLENFYEWLIKEYNFLDCEVIISNPEYRISGTMDVLLENKNTGEVCIGDFKFLQEIQTFSREQSYMTCYTKSSPSHFKVKAYPYEGFKNININKYYCQLSIYGVLLESYNIIEVDKGILFCFVLGKDWLNKKRPLKYEQKVFPLYNKYAKAMILHREKLKNCYNTDIKNDIELTKTSFNQKQEELF